MHRIDTEIGRGGRYQCCHSKDISFKNFVAVAKPHNLTNIPRFDKLNYNHEITTYYYSKRKQRSYVT